jgi:transposase-like protein
MHDEYGYTKEFRDQVLRDADTYGVLTAAAKHKVGKSSIYRWRQRKSGSVSNRKAGSISAHGT